MNKEELIHMLQEEILFLQETKLTKSEIENYSYSLKGDGSESRRV